MDCMAVTKLGEKPIRIDLILFLIIAMNIGCFETAVNGETFVGKALNSKGTLEYVEYHRVTHTNGKVSESQTVYYDAVNQNIGHLTSEYAFGPQFGSYHFRDIRADYEDGVNVSADRIWLFRKRSAEDDAEEKLLPRENDQIVGQGFHQFIVHNIEEIAQGEVFHVRLVLPSRLDQFKFRIRKRKIKGDTLHIRLEIDNWFLRLFAPHVDAEYDLKTRHLFRYEGISNLEDASGQHKKVTITYTYEE
jgi:hypothetical protein